MSRASLLFVSVAVVWLLAGARTGVMGALVLVGLVALIAWLGGSQLLAVGYGRDRRLRVQGEMPPWLRTAILWGLLSLAVLVAVTPVSHALAIAAFGLAVATGTAWVVRAADPYHIDSERFEAELAEILAGGDPTG